VELAMTPSTMYSPLMPLSRCFLHLISLPIYFFPYMSTLVRGHGPHYMWLFFFFGDSNCLMLVFICYQGSIEKLTLLAVIYYYMKVMIQFFDLLD
jgi:hypothetical protein